MCYSHLLLRHSKEICRIYSTFMQKSHANRKSINVRSRRNSHKWESFNWYLIKILLSAQKAVQFVNLINAKRLAIHLQLLSIALSTLIENGNFNKNKCYGLQKKQLIKSCVIYRTCRLSAKLSIHKLISLIWMCETKRRRRGRCQALGADFLHRLWVYYYC